jgi:hypothetical protein
MLTASIRASTVKYASRAAGRQNSSLRKRIEGPSFDANVEELSIELSNDYDYFYFCALGRAPRRVTNVHLALEPRPGSVASV